MVSRTWTLWNDRELLRVSVNGVANGSIEGESRAAMERGVAALIEAGFKDDHIVRSRLYARDADVRRAASDARLAMLTDDRRAASSSYIDPERLPAGANIAIDLVALRLSSAGASKEVREYEPRAAPPMFVALDGMVFLSGNTDTASDYEPQLANIRRNIDASLAAAGTGWDKVREFSVHVSKTLGTGRVTRGLAAHFPEAFNLATISSVEGYSTPAKLVEIEVAAVA
jgi:enamine deaminase RidA (YjgF/YER057c/UK114 family)